MNIKTLAKKLANALETECEWNVNEPECTYIRCKKCDDQIPHKSNFCPNCGIKSTGKSEESDNGTKDIEHCLNVILRDLVIVKKKKKVKL